MTRINVAEMFPSLTRRQREVCALLIQGQTNKDIGRKLGISPRTVEDHRYEICRTVKVTSARTLIYKAFGEPEVIA